ncbi:MAG: RNA polymerase sigma factor [Anaerolineae bacterium]
MSATLRRRTRVPHGGQRVAKQGLALKAQALQSAEEEQSLVRRLKAGDQNALETLFRRHGPRVYRQAIRLVGNEADAEEVLQDVFLTLYEKAKTFRGDAAFSTWLYRLTLNEALTRLRRRKRSKEAFFEDYLPQYQADGHHLVRPVVDWSNDLERRLVSKEVHQLLREALDQLRPVDKAVVVLSDLEGIPNREVGKALGLSVPAVKTRLHRARLFLRGKLAVSLGHSPS